MKQQVDIVSKITFQLDVELSEQQIRNGFNNSMEAYFLGESFERSGHEILTVSEEREIFSTEDRYVFIQLQIRDGEHTYDHKMVRMTNVDTNEFANHLAANLYGEEGEAMGDGYYHMGGALFTKVFKAEEITKHEFETLKKFI